MSVFENTMKRNLISLIFAGLMLCLTAVGQTETLTNAHIIEMAKVGLGEDIVLSKVRSADGNYDVSATALIELKKAGLSDAVISAMMEKADAKRPVPEAPVLAYSENVQSGSNQFDNSPIAPKEALKRAKTIALVKASLQPSRQALEKELMKRADWKQLNLTIERYKESADLYVEIGFVAMSLITHRYVYRIYDRRSGAVIAAGETTSWGSLAENLAKHICKSLVSI